MAWPLIMLCVIGAAYLVTGLMVFIDTVIQPYADFWFSVGRGILCPILLVNGIKKAYQSLK